MYVFKADHLALDSQLVYSLGPSNFTQLSMVFCVGLRSLGLFPSSLSCLYVSSLFRSHLGSLISETL